MKKNEQFRKFLRKQHLHYRGLRKKRQKGAENIFDKLQLKTSQL